MYRVIIEMNQEKKSASGWSSLHKYIMMHCAPPPKKKEGGGRKNVCCSWTAYSASTM